MEIARPLLDSIMGLKVADWLPDVTIVKAFVMVMDPRTRHTSGAYSSETLDEAVAIVRHAHGQFTGKPSTLPPGPDLSPVAKAAMDKLKAEHLAVLTSNVVLVLLWADSGHWSLSYENLPSANDLVAILEGLIKGQGAVN